MPRHGAARTSYWSLPELIESPSFLMTIGAFLLLLGPLIVLHELGHYYAGRLFGVRALTFSVGIGKELWHRIDKRGTRWRIAAVPLGGYVLFAGDADASSKPDPALENATAEQLKGTFPGAALWQRTLIVLAGPLANLLVAVAIIAAFSMAYGVPNQSPVVRGFAEESDAKAAGLQLGDRIVAVNGRGVDSADEVTQQIAIYPGGMVDLTFVRDGKELEVPVRLTPRTVDDGFGNKAKISNLGLDFAAPVIEKVGPGTAAEKAGFLAGDRIVSLDGNAISSFEEVSKYIRPRAGQDLKVGIQRGDQSVLVNVVPRAIEIGRANGQKVTIGQLGVSNGERIRLGPVHAVVYGFDESINIMQRMAIGLKQIVAGERSVKELGGPIKIAQYSGQSLSVGWDAFIGLIALISINLAFINLLPIPTLDGGHLAMYAAEAVRRKPLGVRSQEWAFRGGMALVLGLAVFVTFNDLVSLFTN